MVALCLVMVAFGVELDAVRANMSTANCEMVFRVKIYKNVDYREMKSRLQGRPEDFTVAEEPDRVVEGTWRSDGAVQALSQRAMGEPPKRRDGINSDNLTYNIHFIQSDGIAFHTFDFAGRVLLTRLGEGWSDDFHYGPHVTGGGLSVTGWIDEKFGDEPRSTPTRIGNYTKYIYNKIISQPYHGFHLSFTVDAGETGVPRALQIIAYDSRGGAEAAAREWRLLDSRVCSRGGVVPTRWCELSYGLPDFALDELDAECPRPGRRVVDCKMVLFEAVEFRDLRTPPRMPLEGYREISPPRYGLPVAYIPPGTKDMSFAELRRLCAPMFRKASGPVLSPIDVDPVDSEPVPVPQSNRAPYYLLAGLACVLLALYLHARSRRRANNATLLFMVGLVGSMGCGARSEGRLTAAVEPRWIVYPTGTEVLTVAMTLNNVGGRPVRIHKIDTGCSCRALKIERLPMIIAAGQRSTLELRFINSKLTGPQEALVTVFTDQGAVQLPARFLAYPEHDLSPSSILLTGLVEQPTAPEIDQETVEIVHRVIFPSSQPPRASRFEPPSGCRVTALESVDGEVSAIPDYSYRETRYQLSLDDRTLGTHRGELRLVDVDSRPLLAAPVLWQRLPFIAPTPDRALLGNRPVRIFLRCPDDAVELVKVVKAPPGVKAVVSSTREVLVSLTPDASSTVSGHVEVATTAPRGATMVIPVTRVAANPP